MGDKRKLYLIDRGFQVRFSLLLGLFMLTSSVFFSVVVWIQHRHILSLVEPGFVTGFDPETERRRFLLLLAASQVIYALGGVLAGLFFSHRVAGPIYRLKRHLAGIREGGGGEMTLRKGDFFPEIADEVNRTVSFLEGKGGESKTATGGNDR